MTRDQKIVGIGAASGVAAMIVAIAGTFQLWPSSPSLVDISSRLAYALQANAFAVIPLLAGIITVGNNRFLNEQLIRRCEKKMQPPRSMAVSSIILCSSSSCRDDSA